MSVGRDGASDAVSFLRVGIPAVEFGPVGGGHHGPEEWVSVTSLASYRRALVDFVDDLPQPPRRRARRRIELERRRDAASRRASADDEAPRRRSRRATRPRRRPPATYAGPPARRASAAPDRGARAGLGARGRAAAGAGARARTSPSPTRPTRRSRSRPRSRLRTKPRTPKQRSPKPTRSRSRGRPKPRTPIGGDRSRDDADPRRTRRRSRGGRGPRRRAPRLRSRLGGGRGRGRLDPAEAQDAALGGPPGARRCSTRQPGASSRRRPSPPAVAGRRRRRRRQDRRGRSPSGPRFLAASLLIIVSMAAATSISLLVYLTDIAEGLGDNGSSPRSQDQLAEVDGGDPQNILILGSDKRPDAERHGPLRHDDPAPRRSRQRRDLAALAPARPQGQHPRLRDRQAQRRLLLGGPKLTLRTVKQLTGLDINHVVNINFTGFADAVERDRLRLHRRRPPLLTSRRTPGYAEIDIEAGYQRLCGYNALQYVRYRHDDNDLVRSARQQDFLREARQKVPPCEADRGPRRADRHLHRVHDLRHRRAPIELLELLKTFLARRNAHRPARSTSRPTSATRTRLRDRLRRRRSGGGAAVPRHRGHAGPAASGEPSRRRRRRGRRRRARRRRRRKEKPDEPSRARGPAMEDVDRRRASVRAPDLDQRRPTTASRCSSSRSTTRPRSLPGLDDHRRLPRLPDRRPRRRELPRLQDRPSTSSATGGSHEYYGDLGHELGRRRRSSTTPARRGRSTVASTALLRRRPAAAGRLARQARGSYWVNNTLLQTLTRSRCSRSPSRCSRRLGSRQ